jgi:hypothetical protein
MGLFDQLKNVASQATSGLAAVGKIAMPQELANMQKTHTDIQEKTVRVAQELQAGTTNTDAIIQLRTFLMTHFGHLEQGGDPEPSMAAKANPLYPQLKAGYAALDANIRALETQYLNCSFGYQMADGSIQIPTTDWTEEQWHSVKDQAVQQTARCWKNDDKSQFC